MAIELTGRTITFSGTATNGRYAAVLSSGSIPALTGGGADFQYSMTGTAEGDTLTISTDGTYSFGATGPSLVWLLRPSKAPEAGDADVLDGTQTRMGTGTSESTPGALEVEQSEKMPEGYALKIGSNSSTDLNESSAINRLKFLFNAHTKGFESRVMYMPDSNAQSIYQYLFKLNPDLTGTSGGNYGWQIKETWNASNEQFNSSGSNFFLVASHNKTGQTADFRRTPLISTNQNWTYYYGAEDVVRGNLNLSTRLIGDSNEFEVPLDEPYTVEFSFDQGDTTKTASPWDGETRVHVATETNGEEQYIVKTGQQLHDDTNPDKIIDSARVPGFSRGYNLPLNHHWQMGHHYKQEGWARVAICNGPDYFSASKKQHLIPVSWSDTSVDYELVNGWWNTGKIGGKWLCLLDDTETQVASIQIGEA